MRRYVSFPLYMYINISFYTSLVSSVYLNEISRKIFLITFNNNIFIHHGMEDYYITTYSLLIIYLDINLSSSLNYPFNKPDNSVHN